MTDEEIIDLATQHQFVYRYKDGVLASYVEDTDIRVDLLAFARELLSRAA